MWRGRTIREMFSGEMPGSACARYEALLEDYLEGAPGDVETKEVETHLERCIACREALEAARLGSELVSESIAPAAEPGGAFATRVLARIREAEGQQAQFWRPLEVLASRVAVTAGVLLLVLGGYLVEFRPASAPQSAQTAISENFPELGGQPPQDEILPALAGNGNGH
jgi:predicted anti-sigma-YlaC factor YlaD